MNYQTPPHWTSHARLILYSLALTLFASTTLAQTPPVLNSITFDQSSVDITSGEVAINVTVDISTPDGLKFGCLLLIDENDEISAEGFIDEYMLLSGDEFAGVYTGVITVPPLRPTATWTVELDLIENNDDEASYGANGLPFPAPFVPEIQVVNNGSTDLAPPLVENLTFTPNSVDIGAGSRDVTVRFEASDSSGIVDGFFEMVNASVNSLIFEGNILASRVSGDEFAGTYEFTFTVPQGTTDDEWFPVLFLQDRSNRLIDYGQTFDTPFPGASDQTLAITNTGAGDNPADLVALSIDPPLINVAEADQNVTFLIDLTDDLGVDTVDVIVTRGGQPTTISASLDSGDSLTGTYVATITIPQAEAAETALVAISVTDTGSNQILYTTGAAGAAEREIPAGLPSEIIILNSSDAYDLWLAMHPSIPTGSREIDDDPDGDRIPNGVEFYLGLLPMSDSNSTSLDPNAANRPQLITSPGQFGLAVTISQTNLNLGSGTTLIGFTETSTDARAWTKLTTAPTASPDKEFLAPATGDRSLMRFAVEETP